MLEDCRVCGCQRLVVLVWACRVCGCRRVEVCGCWKLVGCVEGC